MLFTVIKLLQRAWEEYERDRARYFAGAMVYFALMSLVPVLLLVLASLGWVLRFSEVAAGAEGHVLQIIEERLGAQLRAIVEMLFSQLERESLITTVAGIIGLLYTASKLFRHLRMTFRAIWKYEPPLVAGPLRERLGSTMREYVVAFLMVLSGGLLLVVALVLVSLTQWLNGLLLRLPLIERVPAWLLALPSSIAIVGLTFALLFRYLPPVPLKWRHVWLATVLCTAVWIVGAEIVVLFGALFRNEGMTALGAFGALLVLMIWFDKVSQLLFYGAEICKVVYGRDGH